MNQPAWAPPPYQLSREQQAAIDDAPPRVAPGQWPAQQCCILWNVPARFLNGISPLNRFKSVINGRSVPTIDLTGLVYLHGIACKRRR